MPLHQATRSARLVDAADFEPGSISSHELGHRSCLEYSVNTPVHG